MHVLQPLAVLRERFVVHILGVVLTTQHHSPRIHKAAEIVDVAMSIVARDAFAEPERVRDTEHFAKDIFELIPGPPGISRLHGGIEQTLLRRDQRASSVHVDAAAFQYDFPIEQWQLELLGCANGDEVIPFPIFVLGPPVEMKSRDREAPPRGLPPGVSFLPHEDRTEVAGPAAVRGKTQKMHAVEFDAGSFEEPRSLCLMAFGIDEEPDAFAGREMPNDLAVHPWNGLELSRPIRLVVWPAEPRRRVGLPLSGHAEASCHQPSAIGMLADGRRRKADGLVSEETVLDIAVGIGAAVAQERPVTPDLLNTREIDLHDRQRLLLARFRDDDAEWIAHKRVTPEFDAGALTVELLEPDTIHGRHPAAVSDGVATLDRLPRVELLRTVLSLLRGMPSDRRRIKKNVRALECGQARAFGIPLIPAYERADGADFGVERAEAEVAGGEVELLVVRRIVGDMHLAVDAFDLAVGIDHGRRVVIQTGGAPLEQ